MLIQQISVFLENAPGALRDLTRVLGVGNIDLMALSIADTQNFGIVRLIVPSDRIDAAVALLRSAGYTSRVNNVVCAKVKDEPLGLCELLEQVNAIGESVEYLYSFLRSTGSDAMMIFRMTHQETAAAKLAEKGAALVSQSEIDRL